MNRLASLFLALLLTACATGGTGPRQVAHLQVGMTLQQVNSLLGKPFHVTNQGALTVYDYVFNQGQPTASSYYVIIGRDGLVRSFGPNSDRGPE
ncbi:MAG TPA: outer membrane protein assembly factor BamE [Chthoniobacter sp.]|jgi:outer membrane protein assembly factor BamE (lipoprotein component of BamABCDE complex)